MKKIGLIILCLGLLLGSSSCVVVNKKDNGKHIGWYKSPSNKNNSNKSNNSNNSSKSNQGNSNSSKKK